MSPLVAVLMGIGAGGVLILISLIIRRRVEVERNTRGERTIQDDDIETQRSQEVVVYQYHLMMGILLEKGYAVDTYRIAGSIQHLLVREDGALIALNPFAPHDYSLTQRELIGEWFEEKEPTLWEEAFDPIINPVYKRDDTNRQILSHRVKYCLDDYAGKNA